MYQEKSGISDAEVVEAAVGLSRWPSLPFVLLRKFNGPKIRKALERFRFALPRTFEMPASKVLMKALNPIQAAFELE
jgi:hypothetical protein